MGTPKGAVKILEMITGKERLIFRGHQEEIHDLIFTPDKKKLAVSSPDGPVLIWDVGGSLLAIAGHVHTYLNLLDVLASALGAAISRRRFGRRFSLGQLHLVGAVQLDAGDVVMHLRNIELELLDGCQYSKKRRRISGVGTIHVSLLPKSR